MVMNKNLLEEGMGGHIRKVDKTLKEVSKSNITSWKQIPRDSYDASLSPFNYSGKRKFTDLEDEVVDTFSQDRDSGKKARFIMEDSGEFGILVS